MYRIGQGFDVHAFAKDRDLILGGEKFDYEYGLLGHSDADVLAHAIMDALLGALCLGDIGKLFPDTDASYKGADSMKLMQKVYEKITEKGYQIVNVDATVICQLPKIKPKADKIRENVAKVLNTDIENINIKGTTTEELGFTGRKEGIASMCAVLLKKIR
jgi:2-C-methyl-D-erythritol 2,4-cyclodiphosphate synthase